MSSIGGINGFSAISSELLGTSRTNKVEDKGASFADFLKSAMYKASDLQHESQRLTEDFAAGKIDNIHEVMIAAEKADVALQFTMQIRNKILDAYNEIMRMQI